MINLLAETMDAIEQSGHSPDGIIFIGSEESGHQCDWHEFTRMADVEYEDGIGIQQVAQDLIIVFSDGQKMWRGTCEGSEWWEYSTPFRRPKEKLPLTNLFTELGKYNLAKIHQEQAASKG